MAVAKDFGELGWRIVFEMLPNLHNAVLVSIGEDGVASFNDFHPFCFRPEDDTRLLEEIGLLLHAARVGYHQLGVAL